MSFQFDQLSDDSTSIPALANAGDFIQRIQQLINVDAPRLQRLWNYYRNPLTAASAATADAGSNRPYRQAQEWGLPSRITGITQSDLSAQIVDGVSRKEVVVENDIGWRVETVVDYLFGKPITLSSTVADSSRKDAIEKLLQLIFDQNGGVLFLQQLAITGAIYGFVDVLVKLDLSKLNSANPPEPTRANLSIASAPPAAESAAKLDDPDESGSGATDASTSAAATELTAPDAISHFELARIARCIRLEIVEPSRALPLLAPRDYREIQAYAQVYRIAKPTKSSRTFSNQRGWLERFMPRLFDRSNFSIADDAQTVLVTDLISPTRWQRYEDQTLVESGENSLGELPLVHIQNSAMPFDYSGASDVEPLIPLQDELNTRLSDRAHRITMQSFKMYLGKGIENFGNMPVAPGRMWMTDNENAEVVEFGGDDGSPAEDSHIKEVREALDKTSSVTPIAAGAVKGRIGNLTSAAALRVTMQALLAKIDRKRTLYGEGIERICAMSLAWLDRANLFSTSEDERQILISWPSALPTDESARLSEAEAKLRIGVPRDVVLRELGYAVPTMTEATISPIDSHEPAAHSVAHESAVEAQSIPKSSPDSADVGESNHTSSEAHHV